MAFFGRKSFKVFEGMALIYWNVFMIIFVRKLLLLKKFAGTTKFSGDKLSRLPRVKIIFREYELSRMGQFRNFAGINLSDRGKFRLNYPILMRILTIFLYF